MNRVLALTLFLLAPAVQADLIECDAKKAARNAAMEATVGVSGRCDPEKLVEKEREDLADEIDDKVDLDRDEKREKRKDGDGLKLRDKDD